MKIRIHPTLNESGKTTRLEVPEENTLLINGAEFTFPENHIYWDAAGISLETGGLIIGAERDSSGTLCLDVVAFYTRENPSWDNGIQREFPVGSTFFSEDETWY